MTIDSSQSQAQADLATATQTEEENTPLHPAWEEAMAPIPDMLRPGLVAQIRKSEAEAKKAVDGARGGGVAPEWQAFIGQAAESGINPTDLVEAWNASQAIRDDPIGFARDFNTAIEDMVARGQITKEQAASAKVQARADIQTAVDGGIPELQSAEEKRMQALEERQAQWETQQAERDNYQSEQQMYADAQANAEDFRGKLYAQLATAGYSKDAGTLSDQVIGIVGRVAASALDGDQTGTLTNEAAITAAVQNLIAISGGPKVLEQPVTPGAPAQQQFPVGGGRGGVAQDAKPTFGTDREGQKAAQKYREQLMMAEAARQMAAGN